MKGLSNLIFTPFLWLADNAERFRRYMARTKMERTMKTLSCLLFISILFTPGLLNAQLAAGQDNINYEARMRRCYWNGNDDGGLYPSEEPTFIWKAVADAGGGYTPTLSWTTGFPHGQAARDDLYWQADCSSGCWKSYSVDQKFISLENQSGAAKAFEMTYMAWEHDSGDRLIYDSGDDRMYRWGGLVYPQWHEKSAWKSHSWDPAPNGSRIEFETVWRYNRGNEHDEFLDFGTISSGSKRHDNSNRAAPSGADADMGYSSNYNGPYKQSSGDVFYKFHLSSAKRVTISTDHLQTDYDTYIHLLHQSGAGSRVTVENQSPTSAQPGPMWSL